MIKIDSARNKTQNRIFSNTYETTHAATAPFMKTNCVAVATYEPVRIKVRLSISHILEHELFVAIEAIK